MYLLQIYFPITLNKATSALNIDQQLSCVVRSIRNSVLVAVRIITTLMGLEYSSNMIFFSGCYFPYNSSIPKTKYHLKLLESSFRMKICLPLQNTKTIKIRLKTMRNSNEKHSVEKVM